MAEPGFPRSCSWIPDQVRDDEKGGWIPLSRPVVPPARLWQRGALPHLSIPRGLGPPGMIVPQARPLVHAKARRRNKRLAPRLCSTFAFFPTHVQRQKARREVGALTGPFASSREILGGGEPPEMTCSWIPVRPRDDEKGDAGRLRAVRC